MPAEKQVDPVLPTDQQLYVLAAALAGLLIFRSLESRPPSKITASVGHLPESAPLGRGAEAPSQRASRNWMDILKRTFAAISEDRIMALAAGSTYYVLLAIFPALAALVAIYGLFSDPNTIGQQLGALGGLLPTGAMDVLGDELKRLTSQSSGSLSFALIIGLGIAIWSASSGVKSLFDSLNQVYEEKETRGFVKITLITLAFTLGSIALLAVSLAAVVVLPVVLDKLGLSSVTNVAVQVGRWPLLFLILAFALAMVYRFGPNRREPKWRWITWGSAAASLLWIVASLLFSWYAGHFGSFNKTYGSLGAIVGFMVWIWISMIVVLVGAELDNELERGT